MKNKSYKHWLIVFFMCCLSASSIGLCTNSIGVFYTPVSESLNVLRGTFALHATLSTLFTAMTSLFMPKLMKKYNYKILLLIGVLLASISTFLMAYSRSILLFYILGILRGIGIGTYSMVPLTMIISHWFDEKHGIATSIALSFSGLSGAVFSPLLAYWILQYGWETTYMIMALCIIILTIPPLIFPWTVKPQDSNLLPYGYQKKRGDQNNRTQFKIQCLYNQFSMYEYHGIITYINNWYLTTFIRFCNKFRFRFIYRCFTTIVNDDWKY